LAGPTLEKARVVRTHGFLGVSLALPAIERAGRMEILKPTNWDWGKAFGHHDRFRPAMAANRDVLRLWLRFSSFFTRRRDRAEQPLWITEVSCDSPRPGKNRATREKTGKAGLIAPSNAATRLGKAARKTLGMVVEAGAAIQDRSRPSGRPGLSGNARNTMACFGHSISASKSNFGDGPGS